MTKIALVIKEYIKLRYNLVRSNYLIELEIIIKNLILY